MDTETSNRSTLFVFYDIATTDEKKKYWTYGKFPGDWDWIGRGGTPNILYPGEEQFSGPSKNKEKMKRYLNNYFSKLLERGIVKRFKIRGSYRP